MFGRRILFLNLNGDKGEQRKLVNHIGHTLHYKTRMQKVITLGLRHMVYMYSLIHRGVSKNIKRQWMTKKEYMDIAFDQKNPSLPPFAANGNWKSFVFFGRVIIVLRPKKVMPVCLQQLYMQSCLENLTNWRQTGFEVTTSASPPDWTPSVVLFLFLPLGSLVSLGSNDW